MSKKARKVMPGRKGNGLQLGALALAVSAMPLHAQEMPQGQRATITSEARIAFDVPAQALDDAILVFAQQANMGVLVNDQEMSRRQSQPVRGRFAVGEGLDRLLAGSGFGYRLVEHDGVQKIQLFPSASGAAEIQLQPTTIDSSLGTSSDWVYEVPRSVSVITREQIDRKSIRHVADMLEETTGVYSAVNQRDPGLSVNIRGIQDFGRVNMNIDGMRQNFNRNGHQARNGTMYIDQDMLKSITIEKGPSSGMGGGGVLGGIANFQTIDPSDIVSPEQKYGLRLRAGHGLLGAGNGTHFNGSVAVATTQENWSGLISVSERHFGDYRGGKRGTGNLSDQYGGRFINDKMFKDWIDTEVGFSKSESTSLLGKASFNLDYASQISLTYITNKSKSHDGYWQVYSIQDGGVIYDSYGNDTVTSDSLSLDYHFNPDSDLLDIKSKIYRVLTRDNQWNESGYYPAHKATYETETIGWQLENTSMLHLNRSSSLKLNYGIDIFNDKFSPSSDISGETLISALPYVEGATPKGDRTLASIFFNQGYEYDDWLTINGGLRYDRFRLKGDTGMTVYAPESLNPTYVEKHILYDVTRDEGKFSPTLGISIKPGIESLQIFANYGRGWRPPAVTETFMTGRPHGGGRERMYPNPFLKSETSKNWEVGFNFVKHGAFLNGDSISAKLAYFDNRIKNFSYMNTAIALPSSVHPANGQVAFVNNLNTTQFRGIEYQIDYNSDFLYAKYSYTHMIGKNEFCSNNFYLGGAVRAVRNVRVPDPNRPGKFVWASEWTSDPSANAAISCNNIMGNASYMPADRGSLVVGKKINNDTLDLGVRIRYSEGNSKDFSERDRTMWEQALWPSYTTYDAFAIIQINHTARLILLAENITDQAYLVAMGDLNNTALARGRTMSGILELSF